MAIFLDGLWVFSGFSSFIHCAFVVAAEIGRSRATPKAIAYALSFGLVPNLAQADLIGVVSGGIALSLACFNLWGKDPRDSGSLFWRQVAPTSAVAILLPCFRSLAQGFTINDWQNSLGFVGLAGCLGVGMLLRVLDYVSIVPAATRDATLRLPSARAVKTCILAVAGIWGRPGDHRLRRQSRLGTHLQEFQGGPFFAMLSASAAWRVCWGEPTLIAKTTILRKADFEALASYLSAKRRTFFVMGDSTMLYGLLGTRPPQPVLYFLASHAFLVKDIPRLDQRIYASLEGNRVSVVVREKVTTMPEMQDVYSRFPITWAWFTSHFDHVTDFGNYEVWERRPDSLR